jgi:hypothetical protein
MEPRIQAGRNRSADQFSDEQEDGVLSIVGGRRTEVEPATSEAEPATAAAMLASDTWFGRTRRPSSQAARRCGALRLRTLSGWRAVVSTRPVIGSRAAPL